MTENMNNSIQSLRGEGLPGGRVHVDVQLAENHSKPNLLLTLNEPNGKEVCRSMILGTIDKQVEFTLHCRVSNPEMPLTLTCESYLEEGNPIDTKRIEILNLP